VFQRVVNCVDDIGEKVGQPGDQVLLIGAQAIAESAIEHRKVIKKPQDGTAIAQLLSYNEDLLG